MFHQVFLLRFAVFVAVYAAIRWLFLPLLPFLIALLIAVVIQPWVNFCLRRLRFRRKFSAIVFSTALMGGVLGLAAWLVLRLISEALLWLEQLPTLLGRLPNLLEGAEHRYRTFLTACPGEIREMVEIGVSRMAEEGPGLLGDLSAQIISRTSDCLTYLPHLLLFSVTTLLAIWYTAIAYPELTAFVRRQIPARW